jgi:UDP-3-O-[3-hydroxymyristoyl] glucosamine N-acyltransferase
MIISAHQIHNLNSPYVLYKSGNLDSLAKAPLPPDVWKEGHIVCVSSESDLHKFVELSAPIIICLNKINISIEETTSAIFVTPSISAALAVILPFFDRKRERFTSGIHPSAIIDTTAQIDEDVSIGALTFIGPNVKIGKGTKIASQVTIEFEAEIGCNSIIHPQVFIGAYCVIGNFCEIHPHTTIGADGFGYISGPDKKHHKVPQIGRVVVEDHVEIGANCAIDRATLYETRIGQGSKLDNIVHIAHNVSFGKNCILTGGVCIAGSTKIGDNFIAGGASKVSDHLNITDNVILGVCTKVVQDISESGAYVGFPAEKMRNGLKTLASLSSLPKLRKDVAELKEQMAFVKESIN